MSDIKQTVTRTNEQGLDDAGAQVEQQTKRVQTESAAEPKTTVQNVVWYILGVVEVLLALRFVLKLFGANAASGFVNFIYNVTGVLTAPFDNIFGVTTATAGQTKSVFEPSILVAAAVYALIGWGIVKLITINQKD
ncbi:MAG TPA: YggT family protein [Patescibacteria group bacterium]|nr:YggT family protein [Patescibacteria group bacterium]